MNVVLLDFDVLEPVEERAPVIQKSVHDDAGAERECEQVRHCVRRGEVERRVLVVGGEVELSIVIMREMLYDMPNRSYGSLTEMGKCPRSQTFV